MPEIIKIKKDVYDRLDELTKLAADVLKKQGRLVIVDQDELASSLPSSNHR